MSRFKNEVAHLQAHVKTLRLAGAALFVVALLLGFGWWSAPKSLTIHVPPDLRSGSTRKWWDVPPESVYAFTFYIWQQAQQRDLRRLEHTPAVHHQHAGDGQLHQAQQPKQGQITRRCLKRQGPG